MLLLAGGLASAQGPAMGPFGSPFAAPPSPRPGTPARTTDSAAVLRPFLQQQPGAPLPPKVGMPAESALDLESQSAPFTIQLEPPGLERLAISVQSDEQLKERIRQENRERRPPERVTFPVDPVISTETYNGRKWDPMKLEVAPYFVCHGRLYFQQINFERYQWDLGAVEPVICGLKFLYDFVAFPYHLAVEPLRCFEYNTGWCLPGDPVPLLLYPLHPSPTGFVAEVGTILTLVAVFP